MQIKDFVLVSCKQMLLTNIVTLFARVNNRLIKTTCASGNLEVT